jgi:hypothetical protein
MTKAAETCCLLPPRLLMIVVLKSWEISPAR